MHFHWIYVKGIVMETMTVKGNWCVIIVTWMRLVSWELFLVALDVIPPRGIIVFVPVMKLRSHPCRVHSVSRSIGNSGISGKMNFGSKNGVWSVVVVILMHVKLKILLLYHIVLMTAVHGLCTKIYPVILLKYKLRLVVICVCN